MHSYDFSPILRYTVGFDRFQRLLETSSTRSDISYPPYNIESDSSDNYRVSVAVAGFKKEDLEVTEENDTLSISGSRVGAEGHVKFVHQGIAGRDFRLSFNLADHIKIKSANLQNGMLVIDLEREIPDEFKPRTIEIQTNKVESLAKRAKSLIGSEKQAA